MPYKNIEDQRAKDRRQYWRNPEKYRAKSRANALKKHPLQPCRFGARSNRRAKSCPLLFQLCAECQALMVRRRQMRYCSSVCRNRRKYREYHRRTRYGAIRYWRVSDTAEALKLAEEYFNLRMELRPNARHKAEWKRFYASRPAAHPDDSEHPVGTGTEST